MDYELYHDESKEAGYWHGMLLVPVRKKKMLLDYLSVVRKSTGYSHPLGIKKVKQDGKIYDCAASWLQMGVVSLMSQRKGAPEPLFLGCRVKGRKQYMQFEQIVGCKFIVFREKDDLAGMRGHRDYGSKVETTFRIGLKGGLHFLGSGDNPIHIVAMHFDGYEHYRRHIDRDRIVNRLYGLRDYCSIAECGGLIDDRTSNHTREGCQDYDDCQLLQLTDLMVGGFRTVLMEATRPIHRRLAAPVKALVDRYRQGYARMQNSRWRNSFCVSQCYLDSGRWKFEPIEYQRKLQDSQLPLLMG